MLRGMATAAVTPEEMIARAQELIPMLREQQDDAERRGHYGPAVHEEFLRAGFYRMLQPRRFGGLELDMTTFLRTMVAIATGDPGTGWCLTLGSTHAWVVASHLGEEAQAELFGPDGDFRAPHPAAPTGEAVPVEGGYRFTGRWPYASGSPYSTHALLGARVPPPGGEGAPQLIIVVLPRCDYEVLDDWGGGRMMGMNSSGSNTILATDVVVPERFAITQGIFDPPMPTPGLLLHGNPMYLGRAPAPYHASLVLQVIGAARAALDEYADIVKRKPTNFAPFVPRYRFHEDQRVYGHAMAMTDAAETILYGFGDAYTATLERAVRTGEPVDPAQDPRWWAMLQQAGGLAASAVESLTHRSTSSATQRGTRLSRYFHDVTMYRQHISSQQQDFAVRNGAFLLGAVDTWTLR
jgi:3-hydroxy-9,10-secoandrosta-1,3,5(10)-triene-9,17-dione monooxygenase